MCCSNSGAITGENPTWGCVLGVPGFGKVHSGLCHCAGVCAPAGSCVFLGWHPVPRADADKRFSGKSQALSWTPGSLIQGGTELVPGVLQCHIQPPTAAEAQESLAPVLLASALEENQCQGKERMARGCSIPSAPTGTWRGSTASLVEGEAGPAS